MPDLTLSFDNGPEPSVTSAVLDILAARGVRATFFVVGQKAATPEGQALCRRAHEEGHWIGNHTWSHATPLGDLSEAGAAAREIALAQRVVEPFAHPLRLFRPFGGGGHLDRRLLNREALKALCEGGYSCVLWNAVPRDWVDPDGWCDVALRQIAQRPWTLMVLHDLPSGAMAHLDRFLAAATDAGARFRHEIPPDCMPIRSGEIVGDLDELVSD